MDAGMCGTDEVHLHVAEEPMPTEDTWCLACEHAGSYGVEQNEEGEWEEDGEEAFGPNIWLAATATTTAELEKESDYILCGSDTLESLVSGLEKDGMVWR